MLDAESQDEMHVIPFPLMADCDPKRAVAHREIRHLMERAIDDLPEIFRIVFVARDIEELSTAETASFSTCLRRGEDQITPGPAPATPSPRRTIRPGLGGRIPVRRHGLHAHGRQGLGAARMLVTV
jgi:hypothetical protein